ncbi:MAG: hypothetical protein GX846_06705 [Deltaproteobacteria bacterium]|nr:hypothetical protein [Deltaproteobacteria bacterium]
MKKLLICYGAGSFGGLVMSLTIWAAEFFNITGSLGVQLNPALTLPWLYKWIVWSGILGFLFLLPAFSLKAFSRGTLISLLPTLVLLFYIFPYRSGKGVAGTELGLLTPVFVLVFSWIWGVVTFASIKLTM